MRVSRLAVLVAISSSVMLVPLGINVASGAESHATKAAMKAALDQYMQKPSPHPVGKGAAIKDVYFIGSDTLLVDTTAAFADEHPSGILQEEMTLASLIETLSANVPGIARVKFLVDGKERETLAGHADLMSFYQVSAVHELVKELQ